VNSQDADGLRKTKGRLLDRFTVLASERGQRMDFTAGGRELGWQRYELNGMLAAVNDERGALAKPAVDIAVIELAEQQACGHSDYADKWSFYCAEIVHGVFALARET
jgi:hypothetical protein